MRQSHLLITDSGGIQEGGGGLEQVFDIDLAYEAAHENDKTPTTFLSR
jgi:hypothetical protein